MLHPFYQRFGQEILKARRERKMTRKTLANILGVGQMTLYNWEMAHYRIGGLEMMKLVKLFKLPISKFLE
jgi:DNA-binding transcriptional regulator YiaG